MDAASGARPAYTTRHLAALDGLRGIAILLVVWYHTWSVSWLSPEVTVSGHLFEIDALPETGMAGVYLFFFISGFCLFYPYAQTMFDGRPLQSVWTFGYRRLLKIVPSYYLAIALWSVLGLTQFTSSGDALRQILTHLLFIHTFWDDTYSGINTVLWSLAIEVQFYVIFPLLCWAFMRRPLIAFFATVVVANAYRLVVVHQPDASHEIQQLPGMIDIFACGMLSAWAYRAIARRSPDIASRRMLWTGVAGAGTVALWFALENIYGHRHEADWLTTWNTYGAPTIALALVPMMVGSLFAVRSWQVALGNPVLLGLAYVSYNLYLWHAVVGDWLESKHLTAFRALDPTIDNSVRLEYFISSIALAVAVAWAITVLVEKPLLRRRPFQSLFGVALAPNLAFDGVDGPAAISESPAVRVARDAPARSFSLIASLGAIKSIASREVPIWDEFPQKARVLRILQRLRGILTSARALPYICGVITVGVTYFASHGRSTPYNNYTLLADAIRHGRLWIDWPGDAVSDALEWGGRRYVIEAPVPALLMLPFVFIFGAAANQTTLAIILCGVAMGFACALLQRLEVERWSLYALLIFLLSGTDLLWCAQLGDVWFIAHVSAVCFTFIALWELAGKARGWLVILCAIAAIESRFSLIGTLPFYALAVACGGLRFEKSFAWRRLLVPGEIVAVVAIAVVAYNHARWGLFNDIGYTEFFHRDSWGQPTGSPFRWSYVPYELYSYFLRAPVYVEWRQQVQWPGLNVDMNGVALTFTSPALALAFFARRPLRVVIMLWYAILIAAIPNFCYYLNGWYQFGMRHALDFEPFMLVLMAYASRPRMPRWAFVLCIYSALVGVWGVWWWNTYVRITS